MSEEVTRHPFCQARARGEARPRLRAGVARAESPLNRHHLSMDLEVFHDLSRPDDWTQRRGDVLHYLALSAARNVRRAVLATVSESGAYWKGSVETQPW